MTYQALLFDTPAGPEPLAPAFDGETVGPEDAPRLTGQLESVMEALSSREWWSLVELTQYVERNLDRRVSQTSVSARLRDLRKKRFGGHTIDRKNEGGGLFLYRLGRELSS